MATYMMSYNSCDSVDSDDDLIIEEDATQEQTTVSLQARLDQYLTASELGRLAFTAGDIKLATDRFNLALDIELQVELESFNDFGVTGQLLRKELQTRQAKSTRKNDTDKPNSKILQKLRKLYERADISAARHLSDPKWYLQMGGALCMLNEWEKAEAIYKEGLSNCFQDPSIKDAANRLCKLKDMMTLLGNQVENTTPTQSPKPRRRRQSTAVDGETVPRSRSFTIDNNSVARRSKGTNSPMSPLARKTIISESGSLSLASTTTRKRGSVFNIFKKGKSHLESNEFHTSWSSDDLFSENSHPLQKHRERTGWKELFVPTVVNDKLLESSLGSRTIENMRAINALTEL